jgi:hypothetical protein
MSPLDRHIKILQKRYTIEMANLERRHRRLFGRNIDDEVDVRGPVAIEGKSGFENTAHV